MSDVDSGDNAPIALPKTRLTYSTLYGRLLRRAPLASVQLRHETLYPLRDLAIGTDGDFAVALMSAWAVVGDILTFYQDRLTAEGYLRSAVHPESLYYLARTVGFGGRGAISASTSLAITVRTSPQTPPRITVPAGPATSVQSVPDDGGLPVVFETDRALDADAAWNLLACAEPSEPVAPLVLPGQTVLRLEGTQTQVRTGSLVCLRVGSGTPGRAHNILVSVTAVTVDRAVGFTEITWRTPLDLGPRPSAPLEEVVAFRQHAALFGARAPAWAKASPRAKAGLGTPLGGVLVRGCAYATTCDEVKPPVPIPSPRAWISANGGLPAVVPRCMLGASSGIFLGTDQGLFRYADGTWSAVGVAPGKQDVHALHEDRSTGRLYAGATRGGIFRSTDGGATWDSLQGRVCYEAPVSTDSNGAGAQGASASPAGSTPADHPSSPSDGSTVAGDQPSTSADGSVAVEKPANGANVLARLGGGLVSIGKGLLGVLKAILIDPIVWLWHTLVEVVTWVLHHLRPHQPATPLTSPPTEVSRVMIDTVVRAVATDGVGTVYVGTDSGVLMRAEGSLTWYPLNAGWKPNTKTGLAPQTVTALVWDGTGALLAGTLDGVYALTLSASGGSSASWTKLDVPAPDKGALSITSLVRRGDRIFAGTNQGVFHGTASGGWSAANDGLHDLAGHVYPVTSLAYDPSTGSTGTLICTTPSGPYRWHDGLLFGGSWVAMETQQVALFTMNPVLVKAMEASIVGPTLRDVFAQQGVNVALKTPITTISAGDTWAIVLPADATLAQNVSGATALIVRMTGDKHLAVSVQGDLTNTGTVTAAVQGDTEIVVAPATGMVDVEWPGFALSDGQVDLSRKVGEVATGSYVALVQSAPRPLAAVYTVEESLTVPRSAFGTTGSITRLDTQDNGLQGAFSLRNAIAFYQSQSLPIWSPGSPGVKPLSGSEIPLASEIPTMPSGRLLCVSGPQASVAVSRSGGIVRLDGGQEAATCYSVRDLVAFDGGMMAATDGGVVVGTKPTGTPAWPSVWQVADHGITSADVRAVAVAPEGDRYCGTADAGVFHRSPGATTWEALAGNGAPTSAGALLAAAGGVLYAATAERGVYRHDATGWTLLAEGFPDDVPTCLALASDGGVIAGTEHSGVLRFDPARARWSGLGAGLPDFAVQCLALPAGRAVVGTSQGGVFALSEDGARWSPVGYPRLGDVSALLFADGALWAAERGVGVFRLTKANWEAHDRDTGQDVSAMVSWQGGILLGATSRVGLGRQTQPPAWFSPASLFTCPDQVPADLDQGTVSRALADAFKTAGVTLASDPDLRPIVSLRRWLLRSGDAVYLLYRLLPSEGAAEADTASIGVVSTPLFEVEAGPEILGSDTWRLSSIQAAGTLSGAAGLAWQPAGSANAVVAEAAVLDSTGTAGHPPRSVLHLVAPLTHVYDRAAARTYGNVVTATDGETVAGEVLGSGSAAVPNPSFTLARPLTWLRQPGFSGLRSTLSITVGGTAQAQHPLALGTQAADVPGVLWRQVDHLSDAGPMDEVYVLRLDPTGSTVVEFGDGIHGARLPTGVGNVVATYRTGSGARGDVVPERLIVPKRRIASVAAVTNPLAAAGGEDAVLPSDARRTVPGSIGGLGRVVSLHDYVEFAGKQAGVAKVAAACVEANDGPRLHVAAAASDGTGFVEGSPRADALAHSIEAVSGDLAPLSVGGYDARPFVVEASVVPASPEWAPDLPGACAAAVLATFSFSSRSFGQDVSADEIVACLLRVSGVADATVSRLALRGHAAHARLVARGIHWNARTHRIEGPDLLLVVNTDDVSIEVQRS